jgi:hypothetical protein
MNPVSINVDNTANFVRPCPGCGTFQAVRVSVGSYISWQTGILIQDAMPELTDDQREFFITGVCPECWDKMNEEGDD